jgi:protein LTV1
VSATPDLSFDFAVRCKLLWPLKLMTATYTNTENHPALIRSRSAAQAKQRAAKQMAEESAESQIQATVPAPKATNASQDAEEDSGSETEMEEDQRVTVARKKGESSEERKARKAAVKAERSVSRDDLRFLFGP